MKTANPLIFLHLPRQNRNGDANYTDTNLGVNDIPVNFTEKRKEPAQAPDFRGKRN
ncbi:hypothetical protein [Rhodocyclus tenuis]|uniref:Uncharacterized protein n=1 Tax=Rhodocyclus tenuis TaxID=1066 RepID=A0A840G971_RHOTE|nr:hypothetical protein [Rhodocyclus tenuis]MBB4248883.1 hypothetical protein [Rhodocyclus tenuis]